MIASSDDGRRQGRGFFFDYQAFAFNAAAVRNPARVRERIPC